MAKRFFISHSSDDKELVELFVNSILVTGLKIDDEEIYCSSLNGLGNKSGQDFVEEIQKALHSAEISILIITENYKHSEICLNEMGASWLSESYVIPIIVEPISYQNVGALNLLKHCEKMLSTDSLFNVRETIETNTSINGTGINRWKSIVEKFVKDAEKIKLKKPKIVSSEAHQKIIKEKTELQAEFNEISEELDRKTKYIKILESKKDKAVIKNAKKESGVSSFEDEFDDKVEAVKEALSSFNRITGKLLLCNHYNHKLPNLDGYSDEVEESQRKRFLTEECESGNKTANKNLIVAIEEIDSLESDGEFCEWYSVEYKEEYDPSDEEFWNDFYF